MLRLDHMRQIAKCCPVICFILACLFLLITAALGKNSESGSIPMGIPVWQSSWENAQKSNKEGKYSHAINECRKALSALSAVRDPDGRKIVISFELAKAYFSTNDYSKAFQVYEDNRHTLEKLMGEDNLSVAYCYAQESIIRYAEDKTREGDALYQRAMQLARTIWLPHCKVAAIQESNTDRNGQGNKLSEQINHIKALCQSAMELAEKGNTSEADNIFTQMLSEWQNTTVQDNSAQATIPAGCLLQVALFFDGQKKYTKARTVLAQALEGYRKHGWDDDIDFGPYMAALQRRIKSKWVLKDTSASNRITVNFKLYREGFITNLTLVKGCNNPKAEQAAIEAAEHADPFAPLPAGTPSDVDIQFTFQQQIR